MMLNPFLLFEELYFNNKKLETEISLDHSMSKDILQTEKIQYFTSCFKIFNTCLKIQAFCLAASTAWI